MEFPPCPDSLIQQQAICELEASAKTLRSQARQTAGRANIVRQDCDSGRSDMVHSADCAERRGPRENDLIAKPTWR
jgi:hypothetical protein